MKIRLSLRGMHLPRFCFTTLLLLLRFCFFFPREKGDYFFPKALVEDDFAGEAKLVSVFEDFIEDPADAFVGLIGTYRLLSFAYELFEEGTGLAPSAGVGFVSGDGLVEPADEAIDGTA